MGAAGQLTGERASGAKLLQREKSRQRCGVNLDECLQVKLILLVGRIEKDQALLECLLANAELCGMLRV